jgi:5'-3' exonuclease
MNILFDGNFLFHKTFSVWSMYYQDRKKTAEENEIILSESLRDKEKLQVLVRKLIIDMCAAINRFNHVERVAIVIDSSSWRYRMYDDYKYALTRIRGLYYKDFCNALDYFEQFLRKKGFIVSRVDGAEGDDLLYMWSIYFADVLNEELVIITGDSDIRQIIRPKVALFCNNSKNLKFFCLPEKQSYWSNVMNNDVVIESVVPFNVLLYKVIMGDNSDNIPKIKKGFGQVAFDKFISNLDSNIDFSEYDTLDRMCDYITKLFCNFTESYYNDYYDKIYFNLNMTWLNIAVYNSQNYWYNNKTLLYNMIDDIDKQKNKYYFKNNFTLEDIYGLMIK